MLGHLADYTGFKIHMSPYGVNTPQSINDIPDMLAN